MWLTKAPPRQGQCELRQVPKQAHHASAGTHPAKTSLRRRPVDVDTHIHSTSPPRFWCAVALGERR